MDLALDDAVARLSVKPSYVIDFEAAFGEVDDLLAFLEALTDQAFLEDPRFRPTR